MSDETIIAVFDTAAHADAAVRDLEAANVPSSAILRHSAPAGTGAGTDAAQAREPGFWSNLFGGRTDQDEAVYEGRVSSGSTILTVRVPPEHLQNVSAILKMHDPVDIEDRAAGYAATGTNGAGVSGVATQLPPVSAGSATEEVIALSEEQIAVGKRLIDHGTTRIRRIIVETPVEEQVRLHSERVSIERRPAAAGAVVAETAFQDRVIEVRETDEEAVVGKTAYVREEVVVRKDVADRIETIRETVRREEVEITKDGGTLAAADLAPARPKA